MIDQKEYKKDGWRVIFLSVFSWIVDFGSLGECFLFYTHTHTCTHTHTPQSTRMGKKLQPETETNVLKTVFEMNTIATLCGEARSNSSKICTQYGVDIIGLVTDWHSLPCDLRPGEDHSTTSGVILTKMNKVYSMVRKFRQIQIKGHFRK